MRIAVFGSGGVIPVAALRALQKVAEVAVVIRPGPAPSLSERLRGAARRLVRGPSPAQPDGLSKLAAELGVPERRMLGPADTTIAPFLSGQGIDLTCIATFPWRLRADVLAAAPRGTLNAHSSILPRHRGPSPWLWMYRGNDPSAGVTIHVCDEGLDTGPVVRQEQWPLERGYPVVSLQRDVARRGALLLVEIVASLDRGEALASTPQDASLATRAPRVGPGTPMVDFGWPAERAWHFLAGMVGQFREPLRCEGVPVLYDRVPLFELADAPAAAGTLEAVPGGWRLWCHDGFVRLERGT